MTILSGNSEIKQRVNLHSVNKALSLLVQVASHVMNEKHLVISEGFSEHVHFFRIGEMNQNRQQHYQNGLIMEESVARNSNFVKLIFSLLAILSTDADVSFSQFCQKGSLRGGF